MLEISAGLMSLWLAIVGQPTTLTPEALAAIWNTPPLQLQTTPDPRTQTTVSQYLLGLATRGFPNRNQGVWIQSGEALLASHQGQTLQSAASLTKIATTLVALEKLGLEHQFETRISATGPIQSGILQGDLIVEGDGDPLFVWEEAIALGNTLNQLGIRQVTGSLVVRGKFYMNYEADLKKSGQLLKQALNAKTWTPEITAQHAAMAGNPAKPQVAIAGTVQVSTLANPKQLLLVRHQSLRLVELLKQMNIYSNNAMAEMLATSVGGAKEVAAQAAELAGVPAEEIQLINGSGLGPENRMSPRAACALLIAIHRHLHTSFPLTQADTYTISDLFPVVGRNQQGTLLDRTLPTAAAVKTGTLWDVSALAGVIPTRDRGLVWFAILNRGDNVEGFRQQQDVLLNGLSRVWGSPTQVPGAIAPRLPHPNDQPVLGDPNRNQLVTAQTP